MKYIMLDYAEYRKLEKIEEIHKKNMEALEGHVAIPKEDYEEYKQLNHILDELEKWLEEISKTSLIKLDYQDMLSAEDVLNKIKELRGRE